MTDAVIVSLVGGVTIIISALIERVHRTVNSRMSEMIDLVGMASHARGVADERTRADAERGSKL